MPQISTNSFPPVIQPEQERTDYSSQLDGLIAAFLGNDLAEIPGTTRDLLSGIILLPQAAATLKNCTGVISDVVFWAWATNVAATLEEIRDCVCQIANQGGQTNRKLIVSVTDYPLNTDIIPGQGNGPPVLFPIGWVNFVTEAGAFERQFVNHPVQIFNAPTNDPTLRYELWKKPNVEMTARWL